MTRSDHPPEASGAQLRVEGRAPFTSTIEIRYTHRRYDVACRDLSATGLGIEVDSSVDLNIGDVVETNLRLPSQDTDIWVVSEVRWLSVDEPTLVGLEFISRLRDFELSAIRALLDGNQPPLAATG